MDNQFKRTETRGEIQSNIIQVEPGKIYRVREVSANMFSDISSVYPVSFQEERDLFLEQLDHILQNERTPLIPREGVSCCAIDNGKWSRVLIKKVLTDGSVRALFIDYGWSKRLSFTSFFEAPYCFDTIEPLVLCIEFNDPRSVFKTFNTKEYLVKFLKWQWERDAKHWIVDFMGIPQDAERGMSFKYIDSGIQDMTWSEPGCSYSPNTITSGLAETLHTTQKENSNTKDTSAPPHREANAERRPNSDFTETPYTERPTKHPLDEILDRSTVRKEFTNVGPCHATVFLEFLLPPPFPFDICGYFNSLSATHCLDSIPKSILPGVRMLLTTLLAIGVDNVAVVTITRPNKPSGEESSPPMFGSFWNRFSTTPNRNTSSEARTSENMDDIQNDSTIDSSSVGQTTARPIRALPRKLMKSEERPSTSPVGSSLWKEPNLEDPVPSTDIPESDYGQPLIEQPSSSSFPNTRKPWAIPNTRGEKSSLNRDHANSSTDGNPSFHSPDNSSTVTYHNPTTGFLRVWDPYFVTPPEAFNRFCQPPSVSMYHPSAYSPQTSVHPTIYSFPQFLSSLTLAPGDSSQIPNLHTYFSLTPESNSYVLVPPPTVSVAQILLSNSWATYYHHLSPPGYFPS